MAARRASSTGRQGVLLEVIETSQSRRVDTTTLVDLRRHPRFDTAFPGKVEVGDGETLQVTVTNVSLSGLQFEALRAVPVAEQEGAGGAPPPDPAATLQISFLVPTEEGQLAAVAARIRPVYAKPTERDTFLVGVRLAAFDVGYDTFIRYVERRQGHP